MTKTWHNIKIDDITENNTYYAANKTLTLTVDKNGNFIYTDMGDAALWQSFLSAAKLSIREQISK